MSLVNIAVACALVLSVIATLGLAACARAVRFHELELRRGPALPRRVNAGDTLGLPPALRQTVGQAAVLVFVASKCKRCSHVVEALAAESLPVAVMWRADELFAVPEGALSLGYQQEVFEELQIAITPFVLVVRDGIVQAAGLVSSDAEIAEVRKQIGSIASPVGLRDAMERFDISDSALGGIRQ